jgi:amino acid transporter
MAEELTFSRKASGLTRGLNAYDAFGIGFGNIMPTYAVWFALMFTWGVFLHANLYISLAIVVISLGFTMPIVWGVLSASMPRSGGDYVYNTRIINPAFGMAASMGMFCAQAYWNVVQSTWIASPSLHFLGQFMGWSGLVTFTESKAGIIIFGTVTWVIVFLVCAFGWKVYQAIMRPALAFAIAATAFCYMAFYFTSHATFVDRWNAAAAKYDSLDYAAFMKAVQSAAGQPLTGGWTWSDSVGGIAGMFLIVIWAWAICYVAGEIKRPSRAVFVACTATIVVSTVLCLTALIGYGRMLDTPFQRAASWNALNGPVDGYNLPWDTSLNSMIFMAWGFNRGIAVLYAAAWIVAVIIMMVVILVFTQRVVFAWSMDRMAPRFLAEVSPRWGTPLKGYAFLAAFGVATMILYTFVAGSIIGSLVASGMMVSTVFVATGLSAIVFPYRKRCRSIWESSPYSHWQVFGVPMITIAGVLYVAFLLLLLYYQFVDSRTRDLTRKNLILFLGVWAFGVAWYYVHRWRSKQQEIDIDVALRELPPE